MSQVPTSDWSFTQFEDDGGDQTVAAPPPAKKGRLDLKAAARQKVDNFGAMLEATRFLFSALEAHAVCAEQELKKLEAKKPRAKPAAAGGGGPAPPPPRTSLRAHRCAHRCVKSGPNCKP